MTPGFSKYRLGSLLSNLGTYTFQSPPNIPTRTKSLIARRSNAETIVDVNVNRTWTGELYSCKWRGGSVDGDAEAAFIIIFRIRISFSFEAERYTALHFASTASVSASLILNRVKSKVPVDVRVLRSG